jgi:hypothetical protein
MLERVYKWLRDGEEVVILTARVSGGDPRGVEKHIRKWLKKYNLGDLRITAEKDYTMSEFWDDRAIGVIQNKGIPRYSGLSPWQEIE